MRKQSRISLRNKLYWSPAAESINNYDSSIAQIISVPIERSRKKRYVRWMSIAYHQPLPILIPPILMKLDVVDYFVFDRRL
jgi:hypothetical protein